MIPSKFRTPCSALFIFFKRSTKQHLHSVLQVYLPRFAHLPTQKHSVFISTCLVPLDITGVLYVKILMVKICQKCSWNNEQSYLLLFKNNQSSPSSQMSLLFVLLQITSPYLKISYYVTFCTGQLGQANYLLANTTTNNPILFLHSFRHSWKTKNILC